MSQNDELTITRPDDWHLHLRDGDMMRAVLPYSAEIFGRAIIMPNIQPPVRTAQDAIDYKQRILSCLSPNRNFQPLMTCYLTDETSPNEVRRGHNEGVFTALKLYPFGATTNSELGVTSIKKIYRILEVAQKENIPLSIHGECGDPDIDFFDRESVFIDKELDPLRRDFPGLKIILEHITTQRGIEYVQSVTDGLGGTITPHHLYLTRNDLFSDGLNPHMYCLPLAKRDEDRLFIRKAATSGDPHFFLGTDSAPHRISDKEKTGGVPGIFNAPTSLQCVVQLFEEEGCINNLEAFVALNGARFYGLPSNQDTLTFKKLGSPLKIPEYVNVGKSRVQVFQPKKPIFWSFANGQ
jgi:dihydroorotase